MELDHAKRMDSMSWLFDHTKLATFIIIMVMLTIIAGGILVVSQRGMKED